MAREIVDLYQGLESSPLTGVMSNGGISLEKRNKNQDVESKKLAAEFGKLCEISAVNGWTGGLFDIDNTKPFSQAAKEVRKKLSILYSKVYRSNSESVPIYQSLTQPPEIRFFGDERFGPSWEPLNVLFCEADRIFDAGLIEKYQNLSDVYQPNLVDGKIRLLIETGLILERLVNEDPPIPIDGGVYGNVWIKNLAQFDAVLGQNERFVGTIEDFEINYNEVFEGITPVEIKVDYRVRHTTGTNNRLDKTQLGPLPRHVRETQTKLVKIITNLKNSYYEPDLPASMYFVYLRGLLPHAVHYLPLNHKFLSDWRMGILIARDNGMLSDEEKEYAEIVLATIGNRLKIIKSQQEESKKKINTALPLNKLKQGQLLDTGPYLVTKKDEPKEESPNLVTKKDEPKKESPTRSKSVVPPWPLRYVRKLISGENILQGQLTKINFEGDSFYKLSEFLGELSFCLDFDNEQDQILNIFKNSQDMYAWLTDLYQTDQIGGQKTPCAFLATTGDLIPYSSDNSYVGDYSMVGAKKFILEFGGQLLLHLRHQFPQKEQGKIYGNEFKLLRLMAEKVKDRSLILLLSGLSNEDGSRNLLGCDLKKKDKYHK
jgi:hypothetical protein